MARCGMLFATRLIGSPATTLGFPGQAGGFPTGSRAASSSRIRVIRGTTPRENTVSGIQLATVLCAADGADVHCDVRNWRPLTPDGIAVGLGAVTVTTQ